MSDAELSAGFQSDLTVDEDAVDELVTAGEFAVGFDENRDDAKLYAEYRAGTRGAWVKQASMEGQLTLRVTARSVIGSRASCSLNDRNPLFK